MKIPQKLKDEIWEYCRLNDILNIDEFIIKMVQQGYTVEKFGATPIGMGGVKEVEKIVEVVKEIPIEKIVEVIKEVPVEKIIEKEIYVTDDEKVNELGEKINDLGKEIEGKDEKITLLTTNIKKEINEHKNSKNQIDKLKKELGVIRKELEEEKNKPKIDNDIYGEDNNRKKGWFGSNILKKR